MFSLEDIRQLPSYRRGLLAGLQEGRQEGWQEGRQDGRQEGRHEGEAAVLARLLARRFGSPLPVWVQDKLAAASEEELLLWSEQLLDATSLEEALTLPH